MPPTVTTDAFRAIADPTRRRLLDTLSDGPAPAKVLGAPLPISQPALSQHLKVLREAGLVRAERRGRERWYHLNAGPLGEVGDWLARYERFWTDALGRLGGHLDRTSTDDRAGTRDHANP